MQKPWAKTTRVGLAVLTGIAVLTGTRMADGDQVSDADLPTLTVTATRGERLERGLPYHATVIDARALRTEQAVRTLPEVFEGIPGVMVQKTGHAQGSPYIRGFTGYRNVFLMDGVRLNNATFRDGPNQYWNTVDPLMLRRIEIVRGPASMLYGSDAMGGAVQALSRGRESLRPGSTLDRRVYMRYASAENAAIVRGETLAAVQDRLNVALGYSWKSFGDLHGGRRTGRQQKTGYEERHWDAKIEGSAGERMTWTLAHQRGEIDDAWRTHRTVYGCDWQGLSAGDDLKHSFDQRRDLTFLQMVVRPKPNGVGQVRAGISRHAQSEDRFRERSGNRYDQQGFAVASYGGYLSVEAPSPLGTLTAGTEIWHDIVSSYSYTLNADRTVASRAIQGPVGDEAVYSVFGAYVQDEWMLGERGTVILGARYERAEAEAKSVENPRDGSRMRVSGDWDAFTGGARIGLHPDADKVWTLYSGVSQGFRAPNLSDLTRFGLARTDEFETPTPDLKPERTVSAEAGIKAGGRRLTATLVYYYTWIDGMIVRTPTGRQIDGAWEVTKQNAGDGFVQGIEFDVHARLSRFFTLSGQFSWMDGEVEGYPTSIPVKEKEPVSRLMPPTGRMALRWTPAAAFWLEGSGVVATKADRLSRSDADDSSRIPAGGTPGYVVWHARAGWQATPDWVLSLAVENWSDEDYRIHGSGINEPGRNIVVSADWTF